MNISAWTVSVVKSPLVTYPEKIFFFFGFFFFKSQCAYFPYTKHGVTWKAIIQGENIVILAFYLLCHRVQEKTFGTKMCSEGTPGHHPGVQLDMLTFGPSNLGACLKAIYTSIRRYIILSTSSGGILHQHANLSLCSYCDICSLKLGQCNNAVRTTRNQLSNSGDFHELQSRKMCLEISCSGEK